MSPQTLVVAVVALGGHGVGKVDTQSVEPLRRRLAYVHGRWRVTYLSAGEPGEEPEARSGIIVGPLVFDVFDAAIWVAVIPDGGTNRVLIRRDTITGITSTARASPRHRP